MNNLVVTMRLAMSRSIALPRSALVAFLILAVSHPMVGLCTQVTPDVAASKNDVPATTKVITDITNWKHPTKAVFSKYGVKVLKVTLINMHPIFVVAFPFDPQTSPNAHQLELMCIELLRANGNWSYTLEAPEDEVTFEVNWNSHTHKTEVTNHPSNQIN